MYPYFIFYLTLILCLVLFYTKDIRKKYIAFISSFIIILFAAIRYDVGWDYNVYERILNIYKATGVIIYERDELFSNWLYTFSINTNIYLFFVITSILTYGLVCITLYKYSKDYMVSVLLFVIFPLFYLNSFSVIRNFLAVAITFYGIKYILEKKLLRYIITIVLASMFHKSALIALIGILPLLINITPIVSIITMLFLLLLKPLIYTIMTTLNLGVYNLYINTGTSTNGQTAFLLLAGIYTLVILRIFKEKDQSFNKYFFLFSIGISIFVLFWGMGELSHRLSLYFTIYVLLLIPYVVRSKLTLLLYVTACSILFLYIIVTYGNMMQSDFVPYKTLFELRR